MNSDLSLDQQRLARLKYLTEKNDIKEAYADPYAKILNYEKQASLLENALKIGEIPTQEDFIINSSQKTYNNFTGNINNRLRQNISNIATPEDAEDILATFNTMLDDNQKQYLNDKWPLILKTLKKEFTNGMNSESFVSFITDFMDDKNIPDYTVINEIKEEQKQKRQQQQQQQANEQEINEGVQQAQSQDIDEPYLPIIDVDITNPNSFRLVYLPKTTDITNNELKTVVMLYKKKKQIFINT